MSAVRRAHWLVCILALFTVAAEMARSQENTRPTGGRRYALLIGVGAFENLTPLRYAEADVADLSKVLLSDCGFIQDNVILMTGTRGGQNRRFEPVAVKIRKELALLTGVCEEEDMLLIAFAGHGVQLRGDSEHYLCPADADLEDKRTLLGLGEVNKALAGCKARVKLLLVDACRDDPRRGETRTLAKVDLQSVTRPALPTPPGGVAALYSCSEGERSYEHPKLGHGVFFHFVIEALQGKAADGDGQVEVDDLSKYLKREVRAFVYREFGAIQLPEVVNHTRGEIPLSSPLAGLMRKAEESYRAKDYDRTLALCTEVLRLDSGNVKAYCKRAEAYNEKKMYESGMADCNEALRLDPKCAPAYCQRGWANYGKGNYDQAIADGNEAIRLDPKWADAYSTRGLGYYGKGDYDRAIADSTEAIRLDPKCANAYSNRGWANYGKGNFDQAIADCTEAIRLDPKLSAPYKCCSWVHASKGDYDRAIADCTEAIRLDPKNAAAYADRGGVFGKKGNYDQEIADCTEAIRIDPKLAIAYFNRGGAFGKKGNYDQEIADCTEAIRLDPKYALAYTNRGAAYGNQDDYNRCIADSIEAIRLDPKQACAYFNLGVAYANGKHDYHRAITCFTEAIRLDPYNARYYRNRSTMYKNINDARWEADRQMSLRLSGKH